MSETAVAVETSPQQPAQISDAINKKRVENAHSWFKWWIDSEEREFTSAARTLGLGDGGRTVCSKFYHRKLENDPTRIVLAIEALRAQIDGPEGVGRFISFCDTRCASAIFRYANAVRNGHAIGLLVATQGVGKTEAIREFQRRTDGDGKPPVEYVYCRISTHLPSLINDIAEQLGIIGREKGGDPAKLHKRIAQRLKSRPVFLVFDEADALNRRCLEFIRNLNDESGAGSLLVGRPALLKTIRDGVSWTTLNDEEKERLVQDGPLAPFVDRIFFSALPGLSDAECVEITEDVLKARLDDDAIATLLFYVGPNFRLLAKVVGKLRELRIRAGAKIDKKMIEAAWLRLQHLDLDAKAK